MVINCFPHNFLIRVERLAELVGVPRVVPFRPLGWEVGGAPTTPESKLPKLSPHFTFRDACTQKLKSPPTSARQNLEGGVVGFMLSVPKLFPGMSLKNTVGKHVPERASMLKFQPGRFSFTAV